MDSEGWPIWTPKAGNVTVTTRAERYSNDIDLDETWNLYALHASHLNLVM